LILPIAHENLRGRRWPWITVAIIAINFIVFLATIGPMQQQMAEMGPIELHILILSSRYPNLRMSQDASELVQAFKTDHADIYGQMGAADRTEFVDAWDEQIHAKDFSAADAATEMLDLSTRLATAQTSSIAWNYAFHSVDPFARSFITASFLHGGWLHIIFNMWFLWLAGTVLEDLWGRIIYPAFYLTAGVLAFAVHGLVYPHGITPTLGASGAIAGLMGAFLARFPRTRIRLGWVLWVRIIKFYVPAYIVLPLWLGIQVYSGLVARAFNVEAGIAYWAHIGGFAFGALGAYLIRKSGIEHIADQAIEAKVSWTADPLIARAAESLAANNPDAAIADLRQQLAAKPDSLDAWDLLLKAQTKKQDFEGQKETLAALCRLHVVAGELDTAAGEYEAYRNLGGENLPRGVWIELSKYYEREERWETAVEEYENLAIANPSQRAAVSALVSAGRICLDHLHSPGRAENFFRAAESSPAPHSDLDAAIQAGLARCAKATTAAASQYGR
jgi:membrane associated rhomboid family serine protease